MSICERLSSNLFILFIVILVGHFLTFTDGMDIKILTTTIVTTFVLTSLIQCFKCIPIIRYWIILYFFLTPFMFATAFQVFIRDNANVKEQNVSSIYIFVSMILSLVCFELFNHFSISTKTSDSIIRLLWKKRSEVILTIVCWCLFIFLCWSLYMNYILDSGLCLQFKKEISRRYISNMDTELQLHNPEKNLGRLNAADGIPTTISNSFDRGITYTVDKQFPVCRRKLKKYTGEDLKLYCLWHMNNHESTEYNARWTLNGSVIVNSDRITITSYTTKPFYFNILRVSEIDQNDYGEYHLWISFDETNDKIQNNRNINYMLAQMFLIQADDILNYVYVPVGNAVLLRYMFPFSNLIAKSNVSIEWQIESKLIGKTTLTKKSERFSQGCSIYTSIVLWLFHKHWSDCSTTDGQMICNVYMCTPSISFGKHSIIFKRNYFNVTTKLNQRVEIVLPTKYIVLPEEFNYSNNQNEYQLDKDINEIDLSYEEKYLFIRNIFELIVLLSIYCVSLVFCRILMKKINEFFFHISCILSRYVLGSESGFNMFRNKSNIGCLGNIKENPLNSNMQKKHITIISTDQDNEFMTKIMSVLEQNKHKVCVPLSNCYAGMSKNELYSTAIQNAFAIIVICSEELIKEPYLHDIVFIDFILGIVEDGALKSNKILLIKNDHCDISNVLKKKFTVISAIEEFTRESDVLEKVCEWVESIFPWKFRLVKSHFMHYRIMTVSIVLFMLIMPSVLFYFLYGVDRQHHYELALFILNVGSVITIIMNVYLYFIFSCFLWVIICQAKDWKCYMERHLTGLEFIDSFLSYL